MGFLCAYPAYHVGNQKNVWDLRGYVLSGVWVKRGWTVLAFVITPPSRFWIPKLKPSFFVFSLESTLFLLRLTLCANQNFQLFPTVICGKVQLFLTGVQIYLNFFFRLFQTRKLLEILNFSLKISLTFLQSPVEKSDLHVVSCGIIQHHMTKQLKSMTNRTF